MSLLGRTVHENSSQGGTYDTAATANNYLPLCRAFKNFVIVDRIGSAQELVPHLVGSNRRPTGQSGALLWVRRGSNVAVAQALKLLNIEMTTSRSVDVTNRT